MTKVKFILPLLMVLLAFTGCGDTDLVDTNISITDNSWTYAKSIKETVEIKHADQPYKIYFKLRHTADYRYSNLYVLLRIKGIGLNKTARLQFILAKGDGEWTGKGSGDLFTHRFPLLSNYKFPKAGKYTIEIEQNMRDNPLVGISDVGLTVVKEFD